MVSQDERTSVLSRWLRTIHVTFRISLFPTTVSRPAVGLIQPPVQWEPGLFSVGLNDRSVKLITHLHPVKNS